MGSVALPAGAVVGANGAGDAFAAGVLYGLHEQWPMVECLAPRARMRCGVDAGGVDNGLVATVSECLALAKQWGFRLLALEP